jgi:hypothetical protein
VAIACAIAVLACFSGLIVYYEREYDELADWADSLSEEMADLYDSNPSLRGSRWL